MGNSLAIIEVTGMVTAIQVGDIAVKAANVELLGYELTRGAGLVTIKLRGDVGSVKAAVDAVLGTLGSTPKLVGHIVIPRPSEEVEKMMDLNNLNKRQGEDDKDTESEVEEAAEKKTEEKPVKNEAPKEQPVKKRTTRTKQG